MRKPIIAVAVPAALCLLVAGCSSSTNGSGVVSTPAGTSGTSASTPASSPSAPSTPPSSGASGSGSSTASGALATIPIQPADLPAGWTAAPVTPSSEDASKQAEMVACVGGKNTAPDRIAKVEKDYTQATNEADSNVQQMRSQSDVDADVAILHSPKINTCYEQAVRKQAAAALPSGATLKAATFSMLPGTNGGPSNLAAIGHGKLTLAEAGQTLDLFVDIAFITGPKLEAEVDFTGVGAQLPTTLEQHVITAVAGRAAHG